MFLVVVGGIQVIFELLVYYAACTPSSAQQTSRSSTASSHGASSRIGIAATAVHFALVLAHVTALAKTRETVGHA
jgi:hypothetical protein